MLDIFTETLDGITGVTGDVITLIKFCIGIAVFLFGFWCIRGFLGLGGGSHD